MLVDIGLVHYLLLGAALFAIGVAVIIVRRNGVAVLMGLEVILAAASVNFIAFSRFSTGNVKGQVVTIFIIMLAAAEAAVALAIVLNIYQHFRGIDVDEVSTLKE
ncbi:MAG: NADH-quinone oxidoreductase subunit NuoK [Planctomycetes bacterium]|nr:NADH-quinone oxidoreductase subunit NuoK [Planctomycetota bacterium]